MPRAGAVEATRPGLVLHDDLSLRPDTIGGPTDANPPSSDQSRARQCSAGAARQNLLSSINRLVNRTAEDRPKRCDSVSSKHGHGQLPCSQWV